MLTRFCTAAVLAALLGVLVTAGPSAAQTKDKSKDRPRVPDEHLFLYYALEDLHRREVSDLGGQPFRAVSSFVTANKNLYDPLRRRAEELKDGDDLVKGLRKYGQVLKLWEEQSKKLEEVKGRMDKDMGIVARAQANQVLGVGFLYGLNAYSRGDSEAFEKGFARGMVEYARTAKAARAAQERVLKSALGDVAKINADYSKKRYELAKANLKLINEAGGDLETKLGLEKSEFAQKKPDASGVAANPFIVAEKARQQLAKKDTEPEDDAKEARACYKAAALVPRPKAYDSFRAALYSLAGKLANRACVAEAGTAGFSESHKKKGSKKPRTALLARDAWAGYFSNEPFDAKSGADVVLQQLILAHGHNGTLTGRLGKLGTPYLLLNSFAVKSRPQTVSEFSRLTMRYDVSDRPEVWYDFARAASVVGDVHLAQECLQAAVWYGFKDKDRTENDADLYNVRNHKATGERFKNVFTTRPPFGLAFPAR